MVQFEIMGRIRGVSYFARIADYFYLLRAGTVLKNY